MSNKILIPILMLLVAAVAAVLFFLLGSSSISSPRLPSAHYLNNPEQFESNTYSLNVSIINQVTAQGGNRLFMVSDLDTNLPLPVVIPYNISESFLPHQRFIFEVRVENKKLILINNKKL